MSFFMARETPVAGVIPVVWKGDKGEGEDGSSTKRLDRGRDG